MWCNLNRFSSQTAVAYAKMMRLIRGFNQYFKSYRWWGCNGDIHFSFEVAVHIDAFAIQGINSYFYNKPIWADFHFFN